VTNVASGMPARIIGAAARLLLAVGAALAIAGAAPISDAAVTDAIIQQSVADYMATGHPCACPYNLTSNGSHCGGRSAHSRRGGASPICYPDQVTPEMIMQWRRTHTP
jgi:hypothetical protein